MSKEQSFSSWQKFISLVLLLLEDNHNRFIRNHNHFTFTSPSQKAEKRCVFYFLSIKNIINKYQMLMVLMKMVVLGYFQIGITFHEFHGGFCPLWVFMSDQSSFICTPVHFQPSHIEANPKYNVLIVNISICISKKKKNKTAKQQ